MVLLTSFFIAMGINILMFIPAYIWRTDKLTDISYAVSFVVVALFGFVLSGGGLPAVVLLLMVVFWAMRLGS